MSERELRIEKIARLREAGINPYPERYEKTHDCAAVAALPEGQQGVKTAGRLMAVRAFGKLTFGHLQDQSGRVQIALQKDLLGEQYDLLSKLVDIGDHLGVEGETFRTKTGEPTLKAARVTFLGKGLRPLPEKWHGLKDQELRYRQRYLDLLSNPETRRVFEVRSRAIRFVRSYLDSHGFLEVETPILQGAACGAAARPFVTHHHALDIDFYLRISPETYLKRLVTGGLDRVYEIGRNFRNEGIDPSHLQEFTMLEWYAAYWNYRDNMRFVRELIQALLDEVLGTQKVKFGEATLDFSGEWPEEPYRDALLRDTGIDIDQMQTVDQLRAEIKGRKLGLETDKYPSLASLMDALYKRFTRPKLVQPMFMTRHPQALVPLARRNDERPGDLDMFQVVVASWEIVKAYSELVDPIEQERRLKEQLTDKEAGDDETMMLEPDYIECMEYGMPPISGLGLGIDRLICILTDQDTLRDVVFFPMMRHEETA